MSYVDYRYYSTVYQGEIEIERFDRLARKASRTIDYYTFNRILDAGDDVKMAVCELVDYLSDYEEREGREVSSEKVGTYSVTYSDKHAQSNDQKQKQIVRKYLGHTGLMYRGVR